MNREYMFKVINDELSKLKLLIATENSLNLNDKNIFLEDIVANILNILYDLNLINTNLEISNYPSIDLDDKINKIAIQVTTNIKRDKIQNTLNTFFDKNLDKSFCKLYFVVFEDSSYKKEFSLKRKFKFTISDNIITYKKLLSLINFAPEEKLKKIYDFILLSLTKNTYNVNWTMKNSEKSLNNLGKRYNKRLNVYNAEERKIKMFFLKDECKNKILRIIDDLIIHIENNDIKVNINVSEIKSNFDVNHLNEIILLFEKLKEKFIRKHESVPNEYNTIYEFENRYKNLISELKKMISEYFSKVIIYKGVAGIGKSHTLANFINEYYIKQNKPALLILGQDFYSSKNIENQLIDITQGTADFNELLDKLNQLGVIRNINVPIIIDGINESKDKTIWKKGLNDFTKQIQKYSNLKLVLSIRDTYYDFCIPKELEGNEKILIIKHEGFSSNKLAAIKQFFDSYEIKMPVFQIINNEFKNPLFLISYCEIVSRFHIDINVYDYKNFNDIFEVYITKMNDLFKEEFDIRTSKNIIKEILNEYVKKWLGENKYFSYEEFLDLLKPISELYSLNKVKILNFIIDNGLFYKEIHLNNENIIFTYEKYEKISIANYLVETINDIESLEYELNYGILHPYIDKSDRFDNGILEELINVIQFKFNIDFLELINWKTIKIDYYINKAYIKNLIWFTGKYDALIILRNIKLLYCESYYKNDIIDIFLKMAYLENNPLNANVIDNYLKKFTMPQLDYYWSIVIDDYYTNYNNEVIDNIINYCLEYGNWYLNSENAILICKLLSWFLSSTNRCLRDRSTKALTKIFMNHNDFALVILKNFKNTKDLYILERIVAAIYGSVIRGNDNNDIDKLSKNLYSLIYQDKKPIDNIIIKIYALKFFKYVKEKYFINLYDDISNEKKSRWYEKLPTNEEIDKYTYTSEECSMDKRKYAISIIINSMVTEYGRGISHYGDFGRYTLQRFLKPFEYVFDDVQLLANEATKRVFEYGYDYKLFAYYDFAVKYYQNRHEHFRERIGKKYQWIATYELLSKLYDNFIPHYDVYSDDIIDFNNREYFDENHERTYDENNIRYVRYELDEELNGLLNIDVTNFIQEQKVEINYLDAINFNYKIEENYEKYIIKEVNGSKYISLFNLYSAADRKYNLKNIDRNSLTMVCTAFVYSDEKKLQISSYKEYSQGTYNEEYNVQLYDIPFSPEYILNYNRKFQTQKAVENFRTCYEEYIWEKDYDESIVNSIKVVMPQKWIIEEFDLIQKEEGKWYKEDKIFCFQPGLEKGKQELLICYEPFIDFLNRNKLNLGWTIFCEKSHNTYNTSWRVNLFYNYKTKKFKKDIYDKDEWKFQRLF